MSAEHVVPGGALKEAVRALSRIPPVLALPAVLALVHGVVLVEGPAWSSPLLVLDWLFNGALAGLILVYALAIGRGANRMLGILDEDTAWEILAAVGLGAVLLSLALLLLGFLRLYSWLPLTVAFLVLTLWLRGEFALLYRQAGRAWLRWRRARLPTAPDLLQRVALAVLVASMVPVLLRTMLPVTEWDAVIYHLASVKLYLAAHRFIPLPTLALANEPSGAEMLYLPALLVGADGMGKILNLLFALLLGAALSALGNRLFGRFAGWTALILLLSPVWLQLVLPLTLTDFAASYLIVLAAGDACGWARMAGEAGRADLLQGGGQVAGRLLLRAGFFAGSAVSFKLSSAPVGPALLGALVLSSLVPGAGVSRGVATRVRRSIHACLLAGGAALLAPAPWLIKNLYFFGSLTDRIPIAVSNPSSGITVAQTAPSPAQHAVWIVQTFWSMLWIHLGPLSLFALLAPWCCRRPDQRLLAYFFLCGSIVWLLFIPFFEPPRYYIGLIAVAAVLAGGMVQRVLDLLPYPALPRLAVDVLLVLGTLPGFAVGLGLAEDPLFWQVASGSMSRATYLTEHLPAYAAETWANQHLPPGAVPALVNVVSGFYMDRPHLDEWYGETLAALERGAASRRAVFSTWCRSGVGYAVFDRGSGSLDDLARKDVRPLGAFRWTAAPGLAPRLLFSARGVDVLAVHPCAAVSWPHHTAVAGAPAPVPGSATRGAGRAARGGPV